MVFQEPLSTSMIVAGSVYTSTCLHSPELEEFGQLSRAPPRPTSATAAQVTRSANAGSRMADASSAKQRSLQAPAPHGDPGPPSSPCSEARCSQQAHPVTIRNRV